ncbi:endonuclease/exonuclease/phosphatase family protein [Microbacterium sp. 2P01SA-2]|uniref:endonuclease/exonuclease/phosphatase family protein n=1 Tax=unclassified Microbacterium TaxID=2609290 RepID=UPI0039A0E66E
MKRVFGALVVALFAAAAVVVTWPELLRLEREFPFAQLVALRPLLIGAFVGIGLLFLLLSLGRRIRAFCLWVTLVSLVAAVGGAGTLAVRGLGAETLPPKTDDSIRVMTWNTAGPATDAETIAETAVAMQADIVALPETTMDTGRAVAVAMRERGRPMWAHVDSYEGPDSWDANSTALLISPELGEYSVIESEAAGTSNTTIVPSAVAMPVDGDGPVVVAVHAVAPRPDEMASWRSDLQWLADQCASDDVIMAGDFNATLDHMARLGVDDADLGRCHDAARATGNGGIGTWPTDVPAPLGAPIDHIMATASWQPEGSVVISSLDDSGSDHRPLVVQYTRR